MAGAPETGGPTGADEDEPRPFTVGRAAGLLLAILLATGAFFWLAAVLTLVWTSRPSNPDGPTFSIAGSAIQAVIGIAGSFTLFVVAVIAGDRATGGDGPWWRPGTTAVAAACLVAWAALAVTTP